jgi:hypothetical protein
MARGVANPPYGLRRLFRLASLQECPDDRNNAGQDADCRSFAAIQCEGVLARLTLSGLI